MIDEATLNAHNKDEYPPAHTCEHILNRTMVNMFGCPRSRSAHIERRKSKCDYILDECPSEEQVLAVSANVNAVIARALPVTARLVTREEAAGRHSWTGYCTVQRPPTSAVHA